MNSNARREKILDILKTENTAIKGAELAKRLSVSRQVIVQDIAILRANGFDIVSVHSGYILKKDSLISHVFKVFHTDEQVEEELNLFVDLGGRIEDVFVYHKVYGIIKAPMNIRSRKDVAAYMQVMATGKSTQLKNITANYHYHTITADDFQTIDMIKEALIKKGFLAKLQEFEPLDFKNQNNP